MIRQIRHVLGAENVDFSVMTQDFGRTKGYFDGTRQVHLPGYVSAHSCTARCGKIMA